MAQDSGHYVFRGEIVVVVVGHGRLKSLAKALASIQTTPVDSTSITWNLSTG